MKKLAITLSFLAISLSTVLFIEDIATSNSDENNLFNLSTLNIGDMESQIHFASNTPKGKKNHKEVRGTQESSAPAERILKKV